MLIIYYPYNAHYTIRSTGGEATNEEFSRMLLRTLPLFSIGQEIVTLIGSIFRSKVCGERMNCKIRLRTLRY
jgi:hypothetical protein